MPQIHFSYFLAADYASQLCSLETMLPLGEQERGRRFSRLQDRVQFVVARAAVRSICANTFGIWPTEVKMGLSSLGKPYVLSPSGRFEFNITHANGIVVIVWNSSHSVGVDVEFIDESVPVNEISQVAFSKPECIVLSTTSRDQLHRTFFRIWVRKEALLKAEGCGIGDGLRTFSTVNQRSSQTVWPPIIRFPTTLKLWKIVDLVFPPKYIAALAVPPFADVVRCTPQEVGLPKL